jgi:hypothetical protein
MRESGSIDRNSLAVGDSSRGGQHRIVSIWALQLRWISLRQRSSISFTQRASEEGSQAWRALYGGAAERIPVL